MSFEFDNSKNKNHLLDSLIQELRSSSSISNNGKMKSTILKSFITTGLVFNFDLKTQVDICKVYDNIKKYNKIYDNKNNSNFANIIKMKHDLRDQLYKLSKDLESIKSSSS